MLTEAERSLLLVGWNSAAIDDLATELDCAETDDRDFLLYEPSDTEVVIDE